MKSTPLIGEECIVRELHTSRANARYVQAIAQSYDGLCCVFGDGTGRLLLVTMQGQEAELDRLVVDLLADLNCEDGVVDEPRL